MVSLVCPHQSPCFFCCDHVIPRGVAAVKPGSAGGKEMDGNA